MGGSTAQQAPNIIIMTRPQSIFWCGDLHVKSIQLGLCCVKIYSALLCHLLDSFCSLGRMLLVRIKSLSQITHCFHLSEFSFDVSHDEEGLINLRLDTCFKYYLFLARYVHLLLQCLCLF